MDKKVLAIYISGGVLALLAIIFTVVLILGMRNEPVNICTTMLTSDMAGSLLEGYCGEKDTSKYIKNKNVKEAYLELLNDSTDVILVSTVDNDTIEWLKLNGVEIESKVIARDAVVFINNIDNSVDNLTAAQVRGIYSGRDTLWSQFGGKEEEIIAYPAIYSSEEEYMMKEFMEDKVIAKPKYRLKDASFEALISAVSEFLDTRTRAIIYTTLHNIKNVENDEIRVLTVDGAEASEENIKSGFYPASSEIYAIIKSDKPENSQTRKFVEYITSKEGQDIIQKCGYVNLVR